MKKSYLFGLRGCLIAAFLSGIIITSTAQNVTPSKTSKVSGDLMELAGIGSSGIQQRGRTSLPSSAREYNNLSQASDFVQIFDGYVVIEAVSADVESLLSELNSLGLKNGVAYGGMVSGLYPVEKIADLQEISVLNFVRPAYKPTLNIGSVTSQGDKAQFSDKVKKMGVNGFTTKVGVLSDSYNNLGGEGSGVASGDLPGVGNPNGFETPVEILLDLSSGGSDEGRAMAEIVHDVAPGAEIAFHTAFLGQPAFAQGIINLANNGCDVIVDDIGYFTAPFFQDGIVAQAADIVSNAGIPYYSSAGNSADQSYESEFRDGGTYELRDFFSGAVLGEYVLHDFDPGAGVDVFQTVTIPTGSRSFILSLQWDDPFASVCAGCPGADTDLDVFLALVDNDLNSMFIYPYVANTGGDAVEFFSLNNGGPPAQAYLVIGKWTGAPGPNPNPGKIKYIDFGFGSNPEYNTFSSTIFGHSNAENTISVGAVRYDRTPAFGFSPPIREVFSSVGGTEILFDKAGNRISPEVRLKPDVSAPQGTNTTFFGFDYEGDGFPNFFGTSASAPHAAALGALMIEAQGNTMVNSDNIENIIEATAIDMVDPYRPGSDEGYDFSTGAGLVNSVAAINEVFSSRVVQKVRLTSMCSSEPGLERRWRIRNPNPFDVAVNYNVYKSGIKGTVIAKANSDTFFFTEAVPNSPNTTIIKYLGSKGKIKQDVKASSGAFCPNQYSNSAARSVAIIDEETDNLDISSLDQEYLFALYPNPATDNIRISFLVDWEETFDLKLIDGLGKVCLQKSLNFNVNGFEHEINIASLPKGIYIISAQSELRTITQKFVKR